jgi:SRSO17 transposase
MDGTGFLKKGRHAAGVARQYSGTAGRIDNGQIGVFVGYASRLGHALLDRELYLPKAWADDPARWVTGDSVYGDDRRLRMWLEGQPQAYVLAVSGQEYVWLEGQQRQVKRLLVALPEEGGTRLSAGEGATGPRWYDWRWLPLADPLAPAWRRWLLVRRSVSAPTELQASVVFAPQNTTLAEVARVAGPRWVIEQLFEAVKGEVGLDQYEVRSWTGWYRHITLAMWALALLTIVRAGAIAVEQLKKSLPPPPEVSPLTAFKASRGLASR